jgi:hypothetical protein
MRKVLAGVALAIVLSGQALAASPYAGRWSGHGQDTRGDQFDMVVVIHDDGSAGIAYDGVFENNRYACKGSLLPIRASATRMVFRETFYEGTCISGAEVTLFQGKDGLGFAWKAVWEEKGLTAIGALKRARWPGARAPGFTSLIWSSATQSAACGLRTGASIPLSLYAPPLRP